MVAWGRRGCRAGCALTLLVALTAGCSTAPPPTDLNPTGPLSGLPACPAAPAAAGGAPVEGLAVPDGAIVTKVTPQDPLTRVDGYVAMTPVQVRRHYQQRDDLEIIFIEDEIYEAEVLLSDGDHRSYVKALAQCAEGSRFLVVIAPETEGVTLPVPAGAGAGGGAGAGAGSS